VAQTINPLSEGKLTVEVQGFYRLISSLNLMDAPDITNWMKEGGLLLITGYAIKDSPEDFVKLLQSLNEQESSSLGLDVTGSESHSLTYKKQTDYISHSLSFLSNLHFSSKSRLFFNRK
jgi:hypothetical protein